MAHEEDSSQSEENSYPFKVHKFSFINHCIPLIYDDECGLLIVWVLLMSFTAPVFYRMSFVTMQRVIAFISKCV